MEQRGGVFGGDATFTFEVGQWVKHNLGRRVDIRSPSSGAACGFELDVGQEAAIFVDIDGDTLRSGLCSTLDADAVRAHLRPQPVTAAQASLLVASDSSPHLWLSDSNGR